MRPLHWLIALLGAFSIHLALAYGFVHQQSNPVDSSVGAEELGVQIQLGMQGATLAPNPIEMPEVEEIPPQPPKKVPQPEPVKPVEKVVETPKPPTPEFKPVTVSVAKVAPPADALPIQMHDRSTAQTSVATFSPPVQAENADDRNTASASKQFDSTSPSGVPGSQSAQQTAAYAKAKNSYFARLMGTLARNKRYPKEAKKKKEQGTVLLQFSINKRGELLTSNIVESSGYQILDDAALQMLSKASPLPSIPDSMKQQTLEITIPVEYSLITK